MTPDQSMRDAQARAAAFNADRKLSAIEAAQARMREMREQGIQPERLNPIERAQRNPQSLRLAVTAKCWECLGGEDTPNVRREIRECTAVRCPLYPVRPFQAKDEA